MLADTPDIVGASLIIVVDVAIVEVHVPGVVGVVRVGGRRPIVVRLGAILNF